MSNADLDAAVSSLSNTIYFIQSFHYRLKGVQKKQMCFVVIRKLKVIGEILEHRKALSGSVWSPKNHQTCTVPVQQVVSSALTGRMKAAKSSLPTLHAISLLDCFQFFSVEESSNPVGNFWDEALQLYAQAFRGAELNYVCYWNKSGFMDNLNTFELNCRDHIYVRDLLRFLEEFLKVNHWTHEQKAPEEAETEPADAECWTCQVCTAPNCALSTKCDICDSAKDGAGTVKKIKL